MRSPTQNGMRDTILKNSAALEKFEANLASLVASFSGKLNKVRQAVMR